MPYFDVLTIGGATKRYTVQTQSISVHTAFGQSAVNEYSGTLTAIKSITLPDGSTYTFNYDSGTASGNYGELTSVVLPTGGTVSLTYSNYLDSYQNQNRWLTAYSGGAGNYTFTPSVITQCTGSTKVGCQEQVAVKDGKYNQTIYLLTLNNGAWNSQIDVYSGTTTPIMSTATAYDFTTSCDFYNCNGAQWITASSVTTTLSDTGQKAQTLYSYTYPWLAKPSVVKKWDYYTGSPTSLPAKEVDYTYGMFVNGAAFPTLVQMKDATGTVVSQTQYGYSSTVTSTSGLPNHGTAPGARGNVTSVTAGVGSTITTATAYDDAGTPVSSTDGNGSVTYAAAMCSDSLIQTVTYPVSVSGQNLQTKSTYDCSSGLLLSAQDMNGVVSGNSTTYTYFASGSNIGKLQKITYPDGGSATDSYPSTTEVDQTVAQTGSVNITSKAFVDSYGRSSQQVIVAPEGSISSETTYDVTGRPASVTTSHLQGTSASTDGTTSTYYDVLGRKTSTLNPDGTSVSTTYSGATQTVKDELSHTRKYTYDAFHRLVSVWEPNASGTLAYETDYTYSGLDLLVQVDQWGAASGSSSPGDRQRKYAYDSLGRRIAENIPEFQSASYTASRSCSGTVAGSLWTACFAYDNNGNLTSTTDNSGRTTSDAYDALNRVTQETYSDGTLKKVFGYDGNDENGTSLASSGLTTSNARGRLSITRNQSNEGQAFSYDAMGRLTTETYYLPLKAAWNVQVSAAYDLAGNLVSITYPDGRVVAQAYDSANRLNGVKYSAWNSTSVGTSYYNASSFAPPGQVTNATLGNGTTVANTFSNRQTQKSLAYANSSGTLWSRQYSWDKNASNLSLEVDGVSGYGRQYTYDTLDRLLTAQDIPVNNSGSVKASGTITISGTEKHTLINCSGPKSSCETLYDDGAVYAIVNGVTVGIGGYGAGSTSAEIASDLASSINANPYAPVTASASSTVVTITSKIGGTAGNYSLSKSVTYDGTYFSSASFSATTSGSALSGGAGSAPSPALNESYSYDPFGNLTQSGNFGFSYSFNSYNQMVTGFGYAANGQETADIGGHALAYDANDLLLSVAGGAETYVYDSEGNRVEVHGSTVTDYVYFGGLPIASLTGSNYTDFIYVGDALIAEVAGSQTATPTYRVFDGLETLGGYVPATGSLSSAVNYAPYGQLFSGSTSDPFGFTGLQWDTATSLWHATARQFNPQQGRWMTPDPYDGSYNWANPQSLNRYAYVNGRPMWTRDPSGKIMLAQATEAGGAICGPWCAAAVAAVGTFFELRSLFRHRFHGSLKQRPNAGPMSETLGMPVGWHPPTGIGGVLGLPGAGCEFGACGPGAELLQNGGAGISIGSFCENHPIICRLIGLGNVVEVATGTSTEHPGINNEPGVPVKLTDACIQMCVATAQLCSAKAAYSSTAGVFGPVSRGAFTGLMWKNSLGTFQAQKDQCALGLIICEAKTCGSPLLVPHHE